ncbi:flagella synthesis protein FlgN [Motilimonas pumila]|uniref:Flagellar protein FlgN n=1 Tax=Motilimonas pumila TaxID=2303987 RepID=A0A418YGJ2_9GAMM|nr:flagellar protein FlgN [Motilimonas pumila]RJG48981.1 flagellar protein FlgN [Motilimonas pumila]
MNTSQTGSLLQLLLQQLETVKHFSELLQSEHDALIGRHPDTLNQVLAEKQSVLQQIADADANMQAHPDVASLSQPQDPEIANTVAEIRQLFAQCQEKNNINGEIIEMSLRTSRHLTAVLNQAKAANSLTYDAKGKAKGASIIGSGIKA